MSLSTSFLFSKRTHLAHWHSLAVSGFYPPDLPGQNRANELRPIGNSRFYWLGAADLAGPSPLYIVVSMITVKPLKSDGEESSRGRRGALGKAREISRLRPWSRPRQKDGEGLKEVPPCRRRNWPAVWTGPGIEYLFIRFCMENPPFLYPWRSGVTGPLPLRRAPGPVTFGRKKARAFPVGKLGHFETRILHLLSQSSDTVWLQHSRRPAESQDLFRLLHHHSKNGQTAP